MSLSRSRTPRSILAAALVAALALLPGCGQDAAEDAPVVQADPAAPSQLVDWVLPASQPGSASPSLASTSDGRVLLSWTNSQKGRRHILQFSTWSTALGRWAHAPATIAIGNSLFVNWADVPHMAATADGALWAHWLQKNGEAPYAYDVVVSRSRDGGANWDEPVRPHDDGTQTEHGFVSMWAQQGQQLGIAWLDGRGTANARGHHDGQGAMSLRAAVFDAGLRKLSEHEIDPRVCDCCQTDVAASGQGAVLVYRGRGEDEIRDIHLTRFDGNAWSAPVRVHADNWKMPACPVNGPSVAAQGDAVVVGWLTFDGEEPVLRVAHSQDAGASFDAPLELDRGRQVLGRVDVAMAGGQVWVLWSREEADGQRLLLSRRSANLATEYERLEVARPQGEGRATGFPQLQVVGQVAHVVWTEVVNGAPQLRGVRVLR